MATPLTPACQEDWHRWFLRLDDLLAIVDMSHSMKRSLTKFGNHGSMPLVLQLHSLGVSLGRKGCIMQAQEFGCSTLLQPTDDLSGLYFICSSDGAGCSNMSFN